MSITDQVQETLDAKRQEFANDAEFRKLSAFYKEMQQSGIAQKPSYSLPPPDTIGRRFYQIITSHTHKSL